MTRFLLLMSWSPVHFLSFTGWPSRQGNLQGRLSLSESRSNAFP